MKYLFKFKEGDMARCTRSDGINDRVIVGNCYYVHKVDDDNGDIYLLDGDQKIGWFYDWRFSPDIEAKRNRIVSDILS